MATRLGHDHTLSSTPGPIVFSGMIGSRPLRVRLEDYDGTHTEVLERLAEDLASDGGGVANSTWDDAVELVADPEPRRAAGATWLIRRWAEAGHPPSAPALETLSGSLPTVTDKWARLHLIQAVPALPLTDDRVPAWADFCRAGAAAEAPFLRAWAVNALVHLASIDAELEPEAEAALEAALSDPKASVRARARRILEGR